MLLFFSNSKSKNKSPKSDLFSAVGFLSSTTLLAILFSAVTNKVIALRMGTEGTALTGLFRNLGGVFNGTLALGYSTVFLQQMSIARESSKTNAIFNAVVLLSLLQAIVCVLLVCFFPRPLAHWMFGVPPSKAQIFYTQLVLLMAMVNLLLQTLNSLLKGGAHVRAFSALQVLTSLSSLALILPLLSLGSVGLAINVGSGSLIAVLVGTVFLWRVYRPHISISELNNGFDFIRRISLSSLLLVWENLVMLGCLLTVQSLVNRYFGIDSLGNYNAAMLILDTAVLVLMSSVRSYFLPKLGGMSGDLEKRRLFGQMVITLLFLAALGGGVLILAAPFIVKLLFSSKFTVAAQILSLLTLSLIWQVLCWSYNTYLLHKGSFNQIVAIDTVIALSFFGIFALAAHHGQPLIMVAWAYILSQLIGALLYMLFTIKKYGQVVFSWPIPWATLLALVWLSFAYGVMLHGSALLNLLTLIVSLVGGCGLLIGYSDLNLIAARFQRRAYE